MRDGNDGKCGTPGNGESATCTAPDPFTGSNPTLTARTIIIYKHQWVLACNSVASFGTEQTSFLGTLGRHFEEFVDEVILTSDANPAQPPHLALPNYVDRS